MINILLLVFFACSGQQTEFNSIDRNDVIVSSYGLGDQISKEKTDSIRSNFDPIIDQDTLFYYYFGKSYFEVTNGRVVGFKLLDNNLTIEFSNLKIGDGSETLKDEYPYSYSSKYQPSEKGMQIVRVNVTNGGTLTDSFIHFEIDKELITSIYYWEDY